LIITNRESLIKILGFPSILPYFGQSV